MQPASAASGRAWPVLWLFTDERLGGRHPWDPLWAAVSQLPRGSGIVFRHYGWPPGERRALLALLVTIARKRGLWLVGSGIRGAPDGVHWTTHARKARGRAGATGLITAAAHNRRDMLAAFRAGADLVFLSPVFATASHPGASALGPLRFGLLARSARGPVLALGGMTMQRFRRLQPLGAAGFGAIDYWAGSAGPSPEFPASAARRSAAIRPDRPA